MPNITTSTAIKTFMQCADLAAMRANLIVPVSNPSTCFIRSDGNDTTGDGSAQKPFATWQKGWDEGFRVFDFGVGSFGNVYDVTAGDEDVFLIGVGYGKTVLGNFGGVRKHDIYANGIEMLSVASVDFTYQPGAAGSPGSPPSPGNTGITAETTRVSGLRVTGDFRLQAGAGGAGGDGNDVGSPGAYGGNGGGCDGLYFTNCIIGGTAYNQGGAGGKGGTGGSDGETGNAGGTGGAGGPAGPIYLDHSFAALVSAAGGPLGPGGDGGAGSSSPGSPGADGAAGADGAIMGKFSEINTITTGVLTPNGAIVAGTFYANSYP